MENTILRILSQLVTNLTDRQTNDAKDILACGPAVYRLVIQSANHLVETSSTTRVVPPNDDVVQLNLQTLQTLAQEMINTIPFNIVPSHWLRLYTDVALLQSIRDAVMGPEMVTGEVEGFWLASIRRLDMAIIVAGALGERRKEWILELIKGLQARLGGCKIRGMDEPERLSKKARLEPPVPLLFAPHRIPVLDTPPSVEEYVQNHLAQPFILRGYLKGTSSSPSWPACSRWGSADYLLKTVGKGRVVPVEVGRAYDDEGWTQKIIPLAEFLARAGFQENHPPSPPLYLAQYALFDQFPQLERDMSFPDYVWSNPPPPADTPSYSPPTTNDGLIVNVWVGSGNGEIVSPAHTDPYYNCYAQVLGRKRVWLAPPSCGRYMHAYGKQDTGDGGMADQYMTNTSKVPILRPIDDFKQLRTVYPEFFQHVWPNSLEAVLEPGDLIVMPPGWWHAMRGEGDGPAWSVSMWY